MPKREYKLDYYNPPKEALDFIVALEAFIEGKIATFPIPHASFFLTEVDAPKHKIARRLYYSVNNPDKRRTPELSATEERTVLTHDELDAFGQLTATILREFAGDPPKLWTPDRCKREYIQNTGDVIAMSFFMMANQDYPWK